MSNINNVLYQYKDDMSIYNFKTVYNTFLIDLSNDGTVNYVINNKFLYHYNNSKLVIGWYLNGNQLTIDNSKFQQTQQGGQFYLSNGDQISQNLKNALIPSEEYLIKLVYSSNQDFTLILQSNENVFLDENGNYTNKRTWNLSKDNTKFADIFDIGNTNLQNKDIWLIIESNSDNTNLFIKDVVVKVGKISRKDLEEKSFIELSTRYNYSNNKWEITNDGINYFPLLTEQYFIDYFNQHWMDLFDEHMYNAVNGNIEDGIYVNYNKDTHKLNFSVNINALELNPRLKYLTKYDKLDVNHQKSGLDILNIEYDPDLYPVIIKYMDGSYVRITYDEDNYKIFLNKKVKFPVLMDWIDCVGEVYESWKFEYDINPQGKRYLKSLQKTSFTDYSSFNILPLKYLQLWKLNFNVRQAYFAIKSVEYTDFNTYKKITYEDDSYVIFEYGIYDRYAVVDRMKYYLADGTLDEDWKFEYFIVQNKDKTTKPILKRVICLYSSLRLNKGYMVDETKLDKLSLISEQDIVSADCNYYNGKYLPNKINFKNGYSVKIYYNDRQNYQKFELYDNNNKLIQTYNFVYNSNNKVSAIEHING